MRVNDLGVLMQALSAAMDPRKIAVAVIGAIGTSVLSGLLFRLAGQAGWFGIVIGLVGLLALWAGLSLTFGTVTRMAIAQLGSGTILSWRAALTYAVSHIDGFLFGPLVAWIAVVLFTIVEIVVLFIGRIPFLGELVISLLFLPLLLINMLVAITILFGSWLLFPVVAAEGASAIAAPLRVFQIVRRDPVRVVVQTCIAFFLSGIAMSVLFFLLLASLLITAGLSAVGLGAEKTVQILDLGMFASFLAGPFGGNGFPVQAPPPTIGIARFIVSIAVTGFTYALFAVPAVFLIASACAVYLGSAERREELAPDPVGVPGQASWTPSSGTGEWSGAAPAPTTPVQPVAPAPAPLVQSPLPATSLAQPAEAGEVSRAPTLDRCPNCSRALKPGAVFCSGCGSQIAVSRA